jgi:hypothetical protein
MVSDVDDAAGTTAVDSLKQQGINAAFTHCDVSNSEQVRWTAGTTSHQHHCLFVGSFQDKTPTDWLHALHPSSSAGVRVLASMLSYTWHIICH